MLVRSIRGACYTLLGSPCLISVVVRLERSIGRNAKILGLVLGELCDLDVQCIQMRSSHFFIQFLGQHVHSHSILSWIGPKINLSQHLVGEGTGHDKARVTHGAAKVDEATLGQEEHVLAILKCVAIHLKAIE